MPYYKDLSNKLHFLASADSEHLLMPGCVEITDAEANVIRRSEVDARSVADKRLAEYPPMTDYLDGVVKGDAMQIQIYIDACLAVKAKYPKI